MGRGRPPKCRRVDSMPEVTYFKPAGIPLRLLEEIRLSVEEAEAIRLKDIEDLEQEHCAHKMNISRPTFQRVLESARKKVASALLNGKAVRIEGGNFQLAWQNFRCRQGHEWDIPLDNKADVLTGGCPHCGELRVLPVRPGFRNRRGQRVLGCRWRGSAGAKGESDADG